MMHRLTCRASPDNIVAMSEVIIDLHSHTVHSDGSATPEELVERAAQAGARAIAITDHDTITGLEEGRTTAKRLGLEFINGIEISADYSPGTMHILGYYVNDESRAFVSALEELRRARDERNPLIAARLQEMGFDITYEEVLEVASNQVVGRPHFARVMMEKGYVESIQDAFTRFLGRGGAAHVEKKRLSPSDAIRLIHSGGGVAVLAHPYQLKLSAEETEGLISHLAELGLDGIEAIYSRHTLGQRSLYSNLAERVGLLITGGSDYHGTYKPDINIVTGLGDLRVPYSLVRALKARAAERERVN
jgi:3',5'-nucleoside bisphosphate phosphatase